MECYYIQTADGRLHLNKVESLDIWKSKLSNNVDCIVVEDEDVNMHINDSCLYLTGMRYKKQDLIQRTFDMGSSFSYDEPYKINDFAIVARSDNKVSMKKYQKFLDEHIVSEDQMKVDILPKTSWWNDKPIKGTILAALYYLQLGWYMRKDYVPYKFSVIASNFIITDKEKFI